MGSRVLRPLASLVVLAAVALQPSCESCEFTFGALIAGGAITIEGAPPAELTVEVCDGPQAGDCDDGAGFVDRSTTPITYHAELVPEGVFGCSYQRRWLVFTAPGCTPTAIEVIMCSDIEGAAAEAAERDLEALDVTLTCAA